MAALTGPRDARKRIGEVQNDPVKDGEVIYKGAGVCLDANGDAVNAASTAGLLTRGVARDTVDNTDGGKRLDIEEGVYQFWNSPPGADELSQADVLHLCYWVDNQTVGKVATGRSIAGVIKSIDGGNKVSVAVIPLAVPASPPVALARPDDLSPRETPTNRTDPESPVTGHPVRSIDDHPPGPSGRTK